MPAADTGLAKARHVFANHGGMLRPANAIRLGIHPRTLYALRDSGEIEQVGRGLYRLSTAPPLSSPDLVPVAIRIPRAVVCLISALAHHALTTQVPHFVDLALPSHAQIPKIDGVPLRVFWYSEPSFSAGIETVTMDEVPVRIYSPEKTIADCFKYRNKIGLDVAIEALRTYRDRTPKPNFQALAKFAQINRVQKSCGHIWRLCCERSRCWRVGPSTTAQSISRTRPSIPGTTTVLRHGTIPLSLVVLWLNRTASNSIALQSRSAESKRTQTTRAFA